MMNILLIAVFVLLGLILFYATVGQRLPGARCFGYVVGQLVSNNNWRAALLFLLAVVLTGKMLAVYIADGFPKSPLVLGSRAVVEKIPALQEQGVGIADRLLGEEYFASSESATPAESVKPVEATPSKIESSSWWWLVASCLVWLVALLYLPVAFRDEAWGFFSRLKVLGSESVSAGDNGGGDATNTATRRGESDAPRGVFGWFWYLFDEFFVEGMLGLVKKIIGARA